MSIDCIDGSTPLSRLARLSYYLTPVRTHIDSYRSDLAHLCQPYISAVSQCM